MAVQKKPIKWRIEKINTFQLYFRLQNSKSSISVTFSTKLCKTTLVSHLFHSFKMKFIISTIWHKILDNFRYETKCTHCLRLVSSFLTTWLKKRFFHVKFVCISDFSVQHTSEWRITSEINTILSVYNSKTNYMMMQYQPLTKYCLLWFVTLENTIMYN